MTLVIEGATERDLPEITAIERAAFADPWIAEAFRQSFGHSAVYFACGRRDDGQVVGYVVAWFAGGEGEIANLAVLPSAWGTGVGRQLLAAALAEAAARSTTAVYLEVRESNSRARQLYAANGFEEVGRRRAYYRRPVEDAIVLRRTLSGATT